MVEVVTGTGLKVAEAVRVMEKRMAMRWRR